MIAHQPCPCGQSSNAYALYDDHGYCFSCSKYFREDDSSINTVDYTIQYLPWRGVNSDTMRKYGVYTHVNPAGVPVEIVYPYPGEGNRKVRGLKEKSFRAEGGMSDCSLFGMDKFNAGSSRAITITEGELDALSMYQATGYPAVSVRSASSAKKDCLRAFTYLDSFDKIYLAFDDDDAGRTAVATVAPLFDFNKVYHVNFTKLKDANAYVETGLSGELKNTWWSSKRFLPEGIVSSYDEFDAILDADVQKPTFPTPFEKLNELIYGLPLGEVVLVTALEGVGKTEIIRAMEFKLLKETDDNIGTIHLEEDKARQLKGLAGLELRQPAHTPDASVSAAEIKEAYRKVLKREDRLHIYNHFGSDDPDVILNMIRFMVANCGCRYVFLDHITMVISGLAEEDERKALDKISTRLAMMVKELGFCLVLVSHVNDHEQTRGSRYISKIANIWIHLKRDVEAIDPIERNTTRLIVKKNRLGARTGFAGDVYFDIDTYIVSDKIDTELEVRLPF